MAAPSQADFSRRLAPIIVAVVTALTGLLLLILLGARLTAMSYDIPFAWRSLLHLDPNADDIRMVYLDDNSYKQLNPSLVGPLNRAWHGELVDRLTAAGARAIVFDILFDGPSSDSRADQYFADAIRRSRRVILAGVVVTEPALYADKPYDPFLAGAAGWGYANFNYDPRLQDEFFPDPQDLPGASHIPWLARRVVQLLGDKTPYAASANGWFNFVGKPGALRHASYYQALLTNGVPPGFFQNKIVFIGDKRVAGLSGQSKDSFATPYSEWGEPNAPGVDLQATAAYNLLHHNWLTKPPPWIEMALVVLVAAAAAFGFMRLSPLRAALFALGAALLITIIAFLLQWGAHLWFAWLILLVEIALALVAAVLWNSLQLYIDKRLVEESLAARLSPAIVKRMLADPALRQIGGVKQEVSLIFTDIANFSRVSEMMHPDDLVNLLNRYFEAALQCIHETDGTVIDLIGDAIFAIWNAPTPQPDHRDRACRAAIALHQQLVEFEATHRNLLMRTRVGLHTGVACVGNIGSSLRFNYTAIGEAVNLASRLEGLNKHLGANILASRAIQRPLEKAHAWREVGHLKLKGFGRAIEIHELLGGPDQIEPTRPWREQFAQALQDFRARKFEAAAEKFQAVHQLRRAAEPDNATASNLSPVDGPSRFYLERIEDFLTHPPPADWIGEIDLKEK